MAKATITEIRKAILDEVPKDGSSVGNLRLRERIAALLGASVDEADYVVARDELIAAGALAKGQGRGGSVRWMNDAVPELSLASQEIPEAVKAPKPRQASITLAQARRAKTEVKARKGDDDARVLAYQHDQKRRNNPDVGVVTPETDPEQPKTTWAYDPHIDPALQFDSGRAEVERVIDDALASGDESSMRDALLTLKRMAAPYLNWSGKAERTSFDVDTVSLHVHERIDPATILRAVQKRMKEGAGSGGSQSDMFRAWFEDPLPYREAIEFYRHDRGWSNRLIAGDSLLVMNSLLQKEGMAGQVQMIYIDPPYGIKYGSNFQPFVNKRDVKDRSDADLTQEPEMIKAFRDTWELGIHSYLTYLRDRLFLARDLLHESGSVFVQISNENLHLVRNVMDEILGGENLISIITVAKTAGASSELLPSISDYLVWYARDKARIKFRQPYSTKTRTDGSLGEYRYIQFRDGSTRPASKDEREGRQPLPSNATAFRPSATTSQRPPGSDPLRFRGQMFVPGASQYWKTSIRGLQKLGRAGRLIPRDKSISYLRRLEDFPVSPISNLWDDVRWGFDASDKRYVVETNPAIVERCLLMTTDPGDLVLDPTCGSGTAAFAAEKWGRRWITCDTSRVAVTLAKQRLMTASYDYFDLKYPHEGLRGGFIYKTVPHVTLKSIANNPDIDDIHGRMYPEIETALGRLNALLRAAGSPSKVGDGGKKEKFVDFANGGVLHEWEVPFVFPSDWSSDARDAFDSFHSARQAMQKKMDASIAAHADQETLYDQPAVAKDKLRITGPFTVEAVPFPTVLALDETQTAPEADASVARSGESLRQHTWRDELLKTGIRGKGGQMIRFASLEPLPETRYLHCVGNVTDSGERVVVSFGPEHGALEQRQVELAMREAGELFPRPKMIVFCAFTFDPEAAKDIDVTKGITALKAQMNTDLLTEDLRKARSNNQSFWLMGQPDVEVRQRKDGKYEVEVNGFDYFDTSSGELKSGGKKNIAAWSLDTDYDERSLFPRQVFFPMAGAKDGWNKLKKNIKAELNEALLDRLHGTVSLPFEPGENRKVAVKIVDDRGIESLKVMLLP